jgi:hypothetical protein
LSPIHEFSLAGGESLWICDTPGFFDTGGIEADIYKAYGTVRAIHRARTVKPILVLEYGQSRFRSTSQVLETVKRRVSNPGELDLAPFGYVFTKAAKKKRASITKQFQCKKKELSNEEAQDELFVAILDDIIRKTSPQASLVLPLEDDPQKLLELLWSENTSRVSDPKSYFVPFVNEQVSNTLHLQLEKTVGFFDRALESKAIDSAHYYLSQLMALADVLPEAESYRERGLSRAIGHVTYCREQVVATVERLQNVVVHKSFENDATTAKQEIETMFKLYPLQRLACPDRPSCQEVCNDAVKRLAELAAKHVLQAKEPPQGLNWLVLNRESLLLSLSHLKTLSNIFHESPWRSLFDNARKAGIDRFLALVDGILSEAESDCPTPAQLQAFEHKADLLAFLTMGSLSYFSEYAVERINALEARRFTMMELLDLQVQEGMQLRNRRWWYPMPKKAGARLSVASYLQVQLESLRLPREMLTMMSQRPLLCGLLSSQPQPTDLKEAVIAIDAAIVDFMKEVVASVEAAFTDLQEKNVSANQGATLLLEQVGKISSKLTELRSWSGTIAANTDHCH